MLALNDGVNVAKASVLFSAYQCMFLCILGFQLTSHIYAN